jgi:hypothetical protein
LLQSIVDRHDWEPGNAIVLMLSGKGHRGAISFDGKKEQSPALLIDYLSSPAEMAPEEVPRFTVKLHFFDPDRLPPGQRVCDVLLQGEVVLEDFDIAAHRSEHDHVVVRTFRNIAVPHHLDIEFLTPSEEMEAPVVSGVELIRDPVEVKQASTGAQG